MSVFSFISDLFVNKIEPFLKNLARSIVKAEIDALAPIAQKAVADAQFAVITAVSQGSAQNLAAALAEILENTGKAAAANALSVGASSLLAAVGNALATNTTTAGNLGPKTGA